MKKIALSLIIIFSLTATTHAGTFGTSNVLKSGHFALGIEPALTFSPSAFSLFIHGGFGLTRNIDLDLKLGLGNGTSFGADIEFALAPDTKRGPGLSLSIGGHGSSNLGLDATLLLSNQFKTFALYGSLDADFEFYEVTDGTEIITPVYFNLGVAIPLTHKMDFLLEGNIGITDSAASGLSGGIMFYF